MYVYIISGKVDPTTRKWTEKVVIEALEPEMKGFTSYSYLILSTRSILLIEFAIGVCELVSGLGPL